MVEKRQKRKEEKNGVLTRRKNVAATAVQPSYKFITAASTRLFDCLPNGALCKHRSMTIARRLPFQPLTYISHIDETLLDERMRLYQVPGLCSGNLSPLGLCA